MARSFTIEYDDFSGGYYVGNNETQQPKNTWIGSDVAVSPSTGHLIPLPDPELLATSATHGVFTPGAVCDFGTRDSIWYADEASPPNFYEASSLGMGAAIAGVGLGVAAGPVYYAGKVCWSVDGAGAAVGLINAIDPATNVLTSGNTPAAQYLSSLGTYKYWLVGGDSTLTNRMFFSAPNNPLSWTATDYIDIGSTANQITGFVDALDVLYIGTTNGLYALSGVLGATSTLRKINSLPIRDIAALESSLVGTTLTTAIHTYDGAYVISGSTGRRILQDYSSVGLVSSIGAGVALFDGTTPGPYVTDPTTSRAWHHQTGGEKYVVPTVSGRSEYFYTCSTTSGASSIYRHRLNPPSIELVTGTTAFPTRTVTLADYQANSKFVVDSVTVEILVDEWENVTRTIGVQIGNLSIPVGYATKPTQFTRATSQAQSYSFTSEARTKPVGFDPLTIRATSMMAVDFTPNDAGPTYNAAPIVTLQGVELRRLIMRCHEVG